MNYRGAGALPALRSGGCFCWWLRSSHLQWQASTPSCRDPTEWSLHQGSSLGGVLDAKEWGLTSNKPPCATSHKDLVSPHPFPPTGSAFLLCPTLHTLQRPRNQKASDLRISPPPPSMTTAQWKEQALLIYSFSPFISEKASYLTCSNLATATTQLTKEHIPEENIPDLVLNNIIYQKRKELPTTLSCYPKF